jgi:hypothetical protein
VTGAEAAYEAAEAAYLTALRSDAARADLTSLANSLAAAAEAWNAAAYAEYHRSTVDRRDDNDLTERTEVLSELWADIAAAYRG